MATDPDELKRLDAQNAQPQLGMTLTPEQQRRRRIDADMKLAAERINETKRGLRNAASQVGDAVGTAYGTVLNAATVVPRTLYGVATGEIPVTVSHLPDYRNRELEQRRAANWVANNPEQAAAARQSMQDITDRAIRAGLRPRGEPLRPLGNAAPAPTPAMPTSGDGTGADSIGGAPAGTNPAADPEQDKPVPVEQQSTIGKWGGTGIGIGAQGGEIVGRVNTDGIAEFSNLPEHQQAAEGRQFSAEGLIPRRGLNTMEAPSGARVLASGSSATNEAEAFANRGSAANVGRGIRGYLSQGEAGDAQRAIASYEAANAARDRMLPGVTVAGMNNAPRTAGEFAQARLGLRNRAQAAQEQRLRQDAENEAANRRLRERELAGTERRTDLEAQRLQQELETGSLSLEQQRRQAELLRQIQDPNTPESQRAELLELYRAVTTSGKDRYFLQDSVLGYDAMGAPIVGKQVIDTVTGRVIGVGNDAPSIQPQQKFEKGKPYRNAAGQRAVYLGGDPNDPQNWREI